MIIEKKPIRLTKTSVLNTRKSLYRTKITKDETFHLLRGGSRRREESQLEECYGGGEGIEARPKKKCVFFLSVLAYIRWIFVYLHMCLLGFIYYTKFPSFVFFPNPSSLYFLFITHVSCSFFWSKHKFHSITEFLHPNPVVLFIYFILHNNSKTS